MVKILSSLNHYIMGLKSRVGEEPVKDQGPSVDVFEDVRLVEEELMK